MRMEGYETLKNVGFMILRAEDFRRQERIDPVLAEELGLFRNKEEFYDKDAFKEYQARVKDSLRETLEAQWSYYPAAKTVMVLGDYIYVSTEKLEEIDTGGIEYAVPFMPVFVGNPSPPRGPGLPIPS